MSIKNCCGEVKTTTRFNQDPTVRSYTLYIWGRRERGKNRNIIAFTGLSPHCLRWSEGGERGLCCPLCISCLLLLPHRPETEATTMTIPESSLDFPFPFLPQQNDFISGSLALKDAPSGQGQCQEKKKKKKIRKRVCLQPEEGGSGFFFFVPILSRPGRGGTKNLLNKASYFHGDFVFLILFYPLFIP